MQNELVKSMERLLGIIEDREEDIANLLGELSDFYGWLRTMYDEVKRIKEQLDALR